MKGAYHCTPQSVEWYTPAWIFENLRLKFDLDPCSPVAGPVTPALHHFTRLDNGLEKSWFGMVWMNPPYGREISKWLNKMAEHGQGMALIYARTDTNFFHRFVWGAASGIFFFRGRLYFIHQNGEVSRQNAGGSHCLVAYGMEANIALRDFKAPGKYIGLYNRQEFT